MSESSPPHPDSSVSSSKAEAKSVLDSIDAFLEARDYDSALQAGEGYLSKNDDGGAQNAFEVFKVRTKLGDVMYRLKFFDRCLEQYELCRALAEKHVGIQSNEAMETIFKIEKTLSAIAMLEKIGDAEADLKKTLVSQYLLQTESEDGTKSKGTDRANDPTLENELLDNLWSGALEKQKKLDEELKKRPKQKPAWIQATEEFANRKEVQMFQLQLMMCGFVVVLLMGLYQGITYVMKYGWNGPTDTTGTEIKARYKDARHLAKTFEELDYKSTDGSEKLSLKPDDTGILTIGKNRLRGKLLFYDNSLTSNVLTIVFSNLFPNEVFQCRGCSIVSPTGAVFFDNHAKDFKLVVEIENLVKRLNSAPEEKLTANTDLLKYTNPLTMKPQKVMLLRATPNTAEEKAGSIVMLLPPDKPGDFHILGFYSKGRSFAAARERNGWKSVFPVVSSNNPHFDKENLFILCEQDINATTNYFRSQLIVLVALIGVLIAAAIAALIQMKFRDAKVNVRAVNR